MDVSDIQRIAVIGGGHIGHGVAQQFAQAGYPVGLFNRSDQSRQWALDAIRFNLDIQIEFGLTTAEQAAASLSRIRAETDVARAAEGADFVVEAVAENLVLKQAIFRQLDEVCPPAAILATDTSGLSIAAIAAATRRPEQVIGTHHFTPPPLIPGVEVIPGEQTSQATVDTTLALLRKVGKQPAVVKDVPAFVALRLSAALRRQAWAIVEQGIASPEAVDTIWRTTVGRGGLSMFGPLHSSDLSGLNTLLDVHDNAETALAPPSEPSAMIREMVRRGDVGAKSGKGFFDWTPERWAAVRRQRDRRLMELLREDQGQQ